MNEEKGNLNSALEAHPKLKDIRSLLEGWKLGLGIYFIAFLVILIFLAQTLHGDDNSFKLYGGLVGVFVAAALGFLGVLLSKFGDIFKQYSETKNEIIDRKELVRKRLIAFHAEIRGNLLTLADYFAPAVRIELTRLIINNPDEQRYTKGDFSNPVFEDNRPHHAEFERKTIEAIVGYYNLDSNLNKAVEALLDDKYQKLSKVRKLKWHFNTYGLINRVARAGYTALKLIDLEVKSLDLALSRQKTAQNSEPDNGHLFQEIEFPQYEKLPDLKWIEVSPAEFKGIESEIARLNAPSKKGAAKPGATAGRRRPKR